MTPAKNGVHLILSANNADHVRYRSLLSHAFSERALRELEYLPLAYVELVAFFLRNSGRRHGTVGWTSRR